MRRSHHVQPVCPTTGDQDLKTLGLQSESGRPTNPRASTRDYRNFFFHKFKEWVIHYTSNFPSEPLVGNVPTNGAIVWTGVSVIMLLAGLGAMVWFLVGRKLAPAYTAPNSDPLLGATLTPSQKATVKYFLVVTLLFLLQPLRRARMVGDTVFAVGAMAAPALL
jgi:nitric oxide reductase large subunit